MRLEHLTPDQLRQLRPRVGEVMQERIDELLEWRRPLVHIAPPDRTPKLPEPNKTEARYGRDVLEPMVRAGAIDRFVFNRWTLLVAAGLRYKPDYVLWRGPTIVRVDEVKGAHIWEKNRKAFLAAAGACPWLHFRMVQWREGRWRTVYDLPARQGHGSD